MTSVETEALECDPHPTTTIDSQAGENKHNGITIAASETEDFNSDSCALAPVSFVDAQASGEDSDGGLLASTETEHLGSDSGAMASGDIIGMQAGGCGNDNPIMGSGEPETSDCDPYVIASGSTGGNKHNERIGVSTERDALDDSVQAGGSEHDATVMAEMETEALGCKSYARAEVDLRLPLEDLSCKPLNVHEEATDLVPSDEICVTPNQHLEQEVTAATQSANVVSKGSFSSACPPHETVGDGTFEHAPNDNQEEIQGEEHAFDITKFDGEHCIFPALDSGKAEAWYGPEDDVILEDRTFECYRDQHVIRSTIPVGTSSDAIVNHDVVEKKAVDEQLVHNRPLQVSSETVLVDAVHGLEESSSMPKSHEQGHEKSRHQCDEADSEYAEVLAHVKLPSEFVEETGAQEIHVQGDEDAVFVSFSEENVEVVKPETTSLEGRFNPNSTVEEVDNEGNQSNTTLNDKGIHLLKFNPDMLGSSLGMGVEGPYSNNVANEEELHLKIQKTVVCSRIETFKSHEGSITQATGGNEENGGTDSQSNGTSDSEQCVGVEKDALQNERDFSSFVEAPFTSANGESMCVHVNSILSNEISLEAMVPVGESLMQEKRVTSNKNVIHDKDSEVGIVDSHMEVNKLHIEQIENQIDYPSRMVVKSVEEADRKILDTRQSDGEGTVKDRGDVIENKLVEPEQEKEEQEELCLKLPVYALPVEASIAVEAMKKEDITAEMTMRISSSSDLKTSLNSCSIFPPANELPESLKNDEIPVLQSLEPGEENKGEGSVSSWVGADSLAKKRLKKHIDNRMSSLPKGRIKPYSSIVEVKEGCKNDSDDGCSSEPDEELSDSELHKPHTEGNTFGVGDLVWAKVRSHPWWPAQIFDPADASKSARKAKKSGRVLVAFFGDRTFAWLQQSQMIAFRPNFKEKVKQTASRIFCIAVGEALEEICWRSELGLSCVHFKGSLHSASSFPDLNAGIRKGVKVLKCHKDIQSSVQMFRPEKTLEFVKGVACSPLGSWCSTLKFAELHGYVNGLRTCMVASVGFDSAPLLSTIGAVPVHGSKPKRSYSSLETTGDADAGNGNKEVKNMKGKRGFDWNGPSQFSKKAKKVVRVEQGGDIESKAVARKTIDASKGDNDSSTMKFKMSNKIRQDGLSRSEGLPDTASCRAVGSEKSSDDDRETLLALAAGSIKALKKSSSRQYKSSSSCKKKVPKKLFGKSQNHTDSEAAASPRTYVNSEDAYTVTSSLSEERELNVEVKRGKDKNKLLNAAQSPVSSIDAKDMQDTKPSKLSKAKSREKTKEVEMKKEMLGEELEAAIKMKFKKGGDSILKVASDLTGTSVTRSSDNASSKSTGPGPMIKMKDSALNREVLCTSKKAASKESEEDVSLLQLRQDIELLANEKGGGSGKMVKHLKRGDQVDTRAGKTKSYVQELSLAARKRKIEMVHDELSAKLPKNCPISGSLRHDASKVYIKGVEKPDEYRSFDKILSHYSRGRASNVKGSSQCYDEKLSSHMPLGLFMRFPKDFPLPSESQLKAAFAPFGSLQMSATKLYHDSASAQVVFKHGRDAESALRHAKKNAMFGPVAVTYRLQHVSQSKMDAPSPNKVDSSTPVKKVEGASASSVNRAADKEVGTAGILTSSNDGSEPTGDIQDKMMTLLRQVSVLVKPSPDGT